MKTTQRMLRSCLLAASLVCVLGGRGANAVDDESDRDWIEPAPAAYAGRYLLFQADATDPELLIRSEIVLHLDAANRLSADYRVARVRKGKETDSSASPLSALAIAGNHFEAMAPAMKLGWHGTPAHSIKGRFVTRYPPSNAKGPVENGILLDERLFLRRRDG